MEKKIRFVFALDGIYLLDFTNQSPYLSIYVIFVHYAILLQSIEYNGIQFIQNKLFLLKEFINYSNLLIALKKIIVKNELLTIEVILI